MKTQIKAKFQALLDDYREVKKEYAKYDQEIRGWEQDTIHKKDHCNEMIRQLNQKKKTGLIKLDAQFNDKLKQIIADEKKVIIGEPAAKPADYEVKISNALKFLELAGDKLTDDQAYGILKPFESDPETMQLFQAAVIKITEGQGVWDGFSKTFGKTNEFLALINNFAIVEQKASSRLFDSTEIGLGAAIKINMFMGDIDTIDELANALTA